MLVASQIAGLKEELNYTTARGSGPGGQHVNKVETKVVLRWSVANSDHISEKQRSQLLRKLSAKLTKDQELIIATDACRSQLRNKELAFKKLVTLINKSLKEHKTRKATKPSKSAVEKRIKQKKQLSDKKKWRQKPI